MAQQGVLDLGGADVVARGNDHVVGAGLVKKVTIGVLHKGVAGVVPAVSHIVGLARIVQVLAAGGPNHGDAADAAARQLLPLFVNNAGGVTRHHAPDGAAAHLLGRGRNKDVEHFGGANAVEHLQAGGVFPQLAGGVGQALASADAQAQRRSPAPLRRLLLHEGRHLAVKSGRGEDDGGAGVKNQLRHRLRCVGNVWEVHRGTRPHGKDQQPAQAKGEGQRRRAHHDVLGGGTQHMARPGFAGGQHVAVGVHRGFGFAGGARGEGQQRNVISGGGTGWVLAVVAGGGERQLAALVQRIKADQGL